jgi:hypothetical protein
MRATHVHIHIPQAVLSDVTIVSTRRSSTGENMVMVMATMTIEGDPGTGEEIVKQLTQANVAANIPADSGVSIVNIDSVVSTTGEACLFAKSLSLSEVRFLYGCICVLLCIYAGLFHGTCLFAKSVDGPKVIVHISLCVSRICEWLFLRGILVC